MCTRVYVGHLSSRATERDVESFCKGFGKIRDVVLKNGFGFVEFEDTRDAEDAVHDLNGRDLCGERVIVELSRRNPRDGGRGGGSYSGGGSRNGGGYGGRDGGPRGNLRYGPPVQTKYRLVVENLSTRCSWQDLKDLMRGAGEATYCDAHKKEKNLALVCFATHSDLKRALNKYQGKDINGRKIKLIDDTQSGRSRSRSRSPRSRRRRSNSRSKSGSNKSSRSRSRSRSHSPASNGNKNGHSRSRSPPPKNGKRSRSRSASASSHGSEKK